MKTYERGPFHRSEAHARFVESPQQPYAAAVFSARDRRGADALAAKCRLPNLIPAGPWRPCTGIGACKPWRRPAQRIHMTERCHRCANPSCCTVGRTRYIIACLKNTFYSRLCGGRCWWHRPLILIIVHPIPVARAAVPSVHVRAIGVDSPMRVIHSGAQDRQDQGSSQRHENITGVITPRPFAGPEIVEQGPARHDRARCTTR